MNAKELDSIFSQFETLVREGRGGEVRQSLLAIIPKKIPRTHLLHYCNLARRTGLSPLSLRALHPIVRPTTPTVKATSGELIEYAAALSEVGAVSEARKILLEPSIQAQDPRSLLFLSITFFRDWQYEDAIPFLNQYLGMISDPYAKLVGTVNLSAAYCTTGKSDAARDLIHPLLEQTKRQNLMLLFGNLLELAGQVEFQKNNFTKALVYFEESEKTLEKTGSQSLIYPRKWSFLIRARQERSLHEAFLVMKPLMKEAYRQREWETLRDIDRQLAIQFQDNYLAQKVYFGSPFAGYRNRIAELFPKFSPPENFFLCNRWQNTPMGSVLEAYSGTLDHFDIGIKPGALLHRLLGTLLSDFYRPFSIGTLCSELFPDEFYNPFTAHDRVYQAVKRLRQVFEKNNLPIKIFQAKYEYFIKVTGRVSIRLRKQDLSAKAKHFKESLLDEKLISLSEVGLFSVKELQEHLNTSLRTTNRILNEQVRTGKLIKLGKGKNTRYKLAA